MRVHLMCACVRACVRVCACARARGAGRVRGNEWRQFVVSVSYFLWSVLICWFVGFGVADWLLK